MLAITSRFLLLAVLFFPVFPVFAEGGDAGTTVTSGANAIYKCKDEQGRVTYTEKPCDAKVEAMHDLPAVNQQPAVTSSEYFRADPPIEAHKKKHKKKTDQLNGSFQCDGRTRCSQMTSCEEAKFFLAHCPGVKMDGNGEGQGGIGDGVPCESQWCGDDGEEKSR